MHLARFSIFFIAALHFCSPIHASFQHPPSLTALEDGPLACAVLGKLNTWQEKQTPALLRAYEQSLQKRFSDGLTLATDPVYNPVCRIDVYNERGHHVETGSGVLVAHSQHPNKHAILTTWKILNQPTDYSFNVTFIPLAFSAPAMTQGVSYSIKDRYQLSHEGQHVNLGLCCLDIDPETPLHVLPAQRSRNLLPVGKTLLGHSTSYGPFSSFPHAHTLTLHDNVGLRHAMASTFTVEQSSPAAANATQLDQETTSLPTRLKMVPNPVASYAVNHKSYPSGFFTRAMIGTPIFNDDSKTPQIIALCEESKIPLMRPTQRGKVSEIFSQFYPKLTKILRLYQKVQTWSNGYLAGSHTDVSWYTSLLAFGSYQLFCYPHNTVKQALLPSLGLVAWAGFDIFGKALERFASRFITTKHLASQFCAAYAIPLAPLHADIDGGIDRLLLHTSY